MTLETIRRLVANDAHACTFQTFGQYRTALLKAIDQASPGSNADEAAQLAAIYDAFGIGSKARSIHILMENLSNVLRRQRCLAAVERTFFMVPTEPEEEDDGVPGEECLLNWGQDPDEYVRTFREALKTINAGDAEQVFLVATGEPHEGRETYTRHDVRPPLCDAEVLYTHAAPQASSKGGETVADERAAFDKIHINFEGAPGFRTWSKWNEIEKAAGWEAWQARARLAAKDGAAGQDQGGAVAERPIVVTEEMVEAYLKTNDAYWKRTDELPKRPDKWRTGTPSEATMVSLIAALAAAPGAAIAAREQEGIADAVVRMVGEMDDRSSPEDWPEATRAPWNCTATQKPGASE